MAKINIYGELYAATGEGIIADASQVRYGGQTVQGALQSISAAGSTSESMLASNSVTTAKIKDGNVTTAKLADKSVTEPKLGDAAVTTVKIKDLSVTTAKLAASAVTKDKLAENAVDSSKIVDGSINLLDLNASLQTKLNSLTTAINVDNYMAVDNVLPFSSIYVSGGDTLIPVSAKFIAVGPSIEDWTLIIATSFVDGDEDVPNKWACYEWSATGWKCTNNSTVTTTPPTYIIKAFGGNVDIQWDELNSQLQSKINALATKTEVDNRIKAVVGAAPEALDTLEEIANQLNSDSSALTAINQTLTTKANKSDVYTKTEADSKFNNFTLTTNCIKTTHITDANVTEAKLATNAVTTAKVKDGNITKAKLESSLQTEINDLLNNVFPLTVTFTASPTVAEYTGSNVTATFNWNIRRKGTAATPTALSIKKGSDTATTISTLTATGTTTATVNTLGTTQFTFSATAQGLTKTATANVELVRAMYFGFNSNGTTITPTSLTKQTIKSSPAGSYTLTNTATQYMWLCVGENKTINSVKSSGFDVPMEAAKTISGYKCYRSSNTIAAGTVSIVIA